MKKIEDNEIDVLEAISIIWDNRLKIILLSIFSTLLMFFYLSNQKTMFEARVKITPISIFDEYKYEVYNRYIDLPTNLDNKIEVINFRSNLKVTPRISQDYLSDLFLKTLKDSDIFDEAIKQFNSIKINKIYVSKNDYINSKNKEGTYFASYNEGIYLHIKFQKENLKNIVKVSDEDMERLVLSDNWINLLNYIENSANDAIRINLGSIFKRSIKNKEKLYQFQIEDLEISIENSIKQYEVDTKARLSFLNEQAKLARTYGLAGNQNTKRDLVYEPTYYYLRGLEIIEKEIELIKNRTDKRSFITGLTELETKKSLIEENNGIERIKIIFNESPLAHSNEFYASKIISQSSEFKSSKTSMIKKLFLTGLLTAIFVIFGVLVFNFIQNRR
jgi:LPS O-antigen subunit length determinant protein (WzzB/FepE family)